MTEPNPIAVDLVLLRCERCGAPAAVADQDSVGCSACGAQVPVPEAHRNAVRLGRAQDAELRRAEEEWQRFARKTWPSWLATLLALPPALILTASLAAALLASRGVIALSRSPRAFLALSGFLPLAPAVGLAVLAYWFSTGAQSIQLTRLLLAARPGKAPCCRNCGAPLSVPEGALFVRCSYCRTESLVTLDALEARALSENIERAEASAAQAIASAQARRNKALRNARWMALVWIAMIALLLLWALAPAFAALTVLASIDMFALAMLTSMVAGGTLLNSVSTERLRQKLSAVFALGCFLMATAAAAVVLVVA